jgi:signal transduction histidine kinase
VVDYLYLLRPAEAVPKRYEKQVLITNILSFLFFWIALGIFSILTSAVGWFASLAYIPIVALLLLFIPVINRWVSHRLGRVIFCVIPVWLTMAITIYFKIEDTSRLTFTPYFDSRFILMAATVLPGVVFRLEERKQLIICLGSSTLLLFFFDPIHELFGAGFFQRGFTDPSYNYMNYIVVVTYSVLLFGILLLRSVLERSETELTKHNHQLIEKQNEIEAQHEELLQHQEEVMTSSEKLEQANRVITSQQQALEKYNATLEALVEEKSYELLRTNEELIKHNNELLQFSYTVSHNLRGPVARMLGLTRLLKRSETITEREGLQDMILKSSEELDEILKDLSLIIDIRNDLYRVREKVILEDEWNKAASLLGENIKSVYELKVDFSAAPYIFGVRPMIQSIFYNLFSNAIKYQSPDRKLKVEARSLRLEDNKTLISISDNGLGIDLKNQRQNLFKLYKRFHSHVTGKGLGLYLVKTQLDTLGASISVQSEPDGGTSFHLVFSQPEEISRQVFYDNDAVQLCYDGNLNIIIIQWKRPATSKEYREAFGAVLSSLNIYQSPGWVSDIRNQGIMSEEDQLWFVQNIVPELVRCGLKRTAIVGADDSVRRDYYESIKKTAAALGFELRVFDSIEDSLFWMEDLTVFTGKDS